MVSLVKHWKESATVMLAAKSSIGHMLANTQVSAARQRLMCDYKLLLLRRSQKMKFFKNAYVYPGGAIDNADFSDNWAKLFQNYGTDVTKLGTALQSEVRPPIMCTKHNSVIPNEVAFRICAIREAFEESGILLAQDGKQLDSSLGKKVHIFQEKGTTSILKNWQKQVHDDASKFLEMCHDLSIIPDIWGLIEWSNWLTPCHLPPPGRRFDTIFYICATDQSDSDVEINHDETETSHAEWYSPDESLTHFIEKKIQFGPPQIYEMSRLCRFPHLEDLLQYGRRRAPRGCERWLTVKVNVEDGIIWCLPGDTLYPSEPDLYGDHPIPTAPGTCVSRRQDPDLHRVENVMPNQILQCNMKTLYPEHMPPLNYQDLLEFVPDHLKSSL